jgi:hypothetical protein
MPGEIIEIFLNIIVINTLFPSCGNFAIGGSTAFGMKRKLKEAGKIEGSMQARNEVFRKNCRLEG